MEALGLEPRRGGNWFTGYTSYGNEWFLFPTVGEPGRTGHDYPNRWVDDGLEWFAKNGHRLSTSSIKALTKPGATVHLFTRPHARDPFTYRGVVEPLEVFDEPTARIIWRVRRDAPIPPLPEEIPPRVHVVEGGKIRITVNAYERDRGARARCLEHWGTACQVCGMNFFERYGHIGAGFIHVHHLKPIASIGERYELDPIEDLRPVCPNCHAMLHTQDPPLTIEELRAVLRDHSD